MPFSHTGGPAADGEFCVCGVAAELLLKKSAAGTLTDSEAAQLSRIKGKKASAEAAPEDDEVTAPCPA